MNAYDTSAENCLAVSNLKEFRFLQESGHDFSAYKRLYFGDEFCMHLIPTPGEVRELHEFAREAGLGFTLVTPYVTSRGLEKLDEAFKVLAELEPEAEVVANDWGVLHFVNREYPSFRKHLGRGLNKLKRGPRILYMKGMVPEEGYKTSCRASLSSDEFQEFAQKYSLGMVEIDNVKQELVLDIEDAPFTTALHVPYVYVSTTRICLTAAFHRNKLVPVDSYEPCPRPCLNAAFEMETQFKPWPQRGNPFSYEQAKQVEGKPPAEPFHMVYKGNGIYYRNYDLPENFDALCVSRIIHHHPPQFAEGAVQEPMGTVRM